jgi:hypothetical protein
MPYNLSKLCLILFLSSFSISGAYGSESEESESESEAKNTNSRKSAVTLKRKELASEKQAEEKTENKGKKPRVKKESQNVSTHDEEEEEETEEKEKEEYNRGTTESSSGEIQARASSEIGKWMGDKEKGIETLKLTYKGKLISEEIKDWHIKSGEGINKIVEVIGTGKTTNFTKARIDFVYKTQEAYEVIGQEIPAIFISGHTTEGAKTQVQEMQGHTSTINALPYIPISSYFEWSDVSKHYEEIREEFRPLFDKTGLYQHGSQPDLIASELLNKKLEALDNPNPRAFQYWLHSEESLIFYFLDKQPILANDAKFETFSKILSEIPLPKGSVPELCIISMVSKNDCCTNCKPLVLEAIQHKEFVEASILKGLGLESSITFKKVLLYSALQDFKINRPEEGYVAQLELQEEDISALFLMAGNNPSSESSDANL